MRPMHASRDPGRFIVDYGYCVEPVACMDETELHERNVLAGIRRAESERFELAGVSALGDEEALPSEVFFG